MRHKERIWWIIIGVLAFGETGGVLKKIGVIHI